jgi:mRNA interferase RelE/StbE
MSGYTVYVAPAAWAELRDLPGNMRQRIRRAIDALAAQPYPPESKVLTLPQVSGVVCRLRLERWRVIYTIDEAERIVDVLAVRKRPPYDYGDLSSLLQQRS